MDKIRIYEVEWGETDNELDPGETLQFQETFATSGDVNTVIERFLISKKCIDIISVNCIREVPTLEAILKEREQTRGRNNK